GIFFRVTFSTNSAAAAVVFRSSFMVANGFLSDMVINLVNFFENTTVEASRSVLVRLPDCFIPAWSAGIRLTWMSPEGRPDVVAPPEGGHAGPPLQNASLFSFSQLLRRYSNR